MKRKRKHPALVFVLALLGIFGSHESLCQGMSHQQSEALWKEVQAELRGITVTGNQHSVCIHIRELEEPRRVETIRKLATVLPDREFGQGSWAFGSELESVGDPVRIRDVAAMVCAQLMGITDPKFVVDLSDALDVREMKIQKLRKRITPHSGSNK